jgi:hypothetical protein
MTSAPLDFAALLSRDYRPARLTHLIPREAIKDSGDKEPSSLQLQANGSDDDISSSLKKEHHHHQHHPSKDQPKKVGITFENNVFSKKKSKVEAEEESCRLVLQLVSKTHAFSRHLQGDVTEESTRKVVNDFELQTKYISKPPHVISQEYNEEQGSSKFLAPSFHQIELGNWESKINWDGYTEDDDDDEHDLAKPTENNATSNDTTTALVIRKANKPEPVDASSLLQQRRNPYLDHFAESLSAMISWSGAPEDVMEKAKRQPLLLELGVAGRSVARHVLPAHRPLPYVKADVYQQRIEDQWGDFAITSTAELSRGTLHADKDKMERLIARRQEKRRQMAMDKTNRVTEAMGTLDVLDGGRGRTITSSLMGPGGTERTGRPSRNNVGNTSHDTEYVEQLDMVNNHVLVRDLSKVALRQYHRPKLPFSVVRTSLIWQFQIRYIPANNKKTTTGTSGDNSSSYQAMMMGTHAGAVSKAKLRTEADLSPTEGNLVMFEYSEERPPVQLTKGMASKIVTYFRGDKARCPVSAGGGDRPTRRKRSGSDTGINEETRSSQQTKSDRPPRMVGPNHAVLGTSITDWVGKPPKKNREDRNSEKTSINVLPEGLTEILHPKVHGPFIGEIEEGQTVTALISNLFVAPIFRHEPESTDFLMILGRNAGMAVPGRHESLGVVLRELPSSVFTVGQTEPRTRVYAPNTQGEKNFIGPFVSYQIAKALSRTEAREGHGLRFDEIQAHVLPNLGLPANALRQRLKQVAIYDKNTQIWTTKMIGYEDYPGVDALGKQLPPEGVASYEASSAAVRRLSDLGIHQLFSGAHAVSSVGVTMVCVSTFSISLLFWTLSLTFPFTPRLPGIFGRPTECNQRVGS